jgi:methyltransferase (TIGR00027 family)
LVAFYRALETLEPSRPPLFRDAHARLFLPAGLKRWARAARVPAIHRSLTWFVDIYAPGARLAHVARARLIDDVVRRRVRAGARNLVLLGAGFDCRAHRLSETQGLTVFEVDLPDVLEEKQRILRDGKTFREDIRYVALDLVRDDLGTVLAHAGLDVAASTLVVGEGVANYLPEAAVRRLLAWVGRCSPTSSVVFSYVHLDFLDGTLRFPGSERMLRRGLSGGERWISGFRPDELCSILSEHGLTLIEDLGSAEYRGRYLPTPPNARRFSLYRVAEAEVRGSS